jgi:hypothetical protein
MMEKSPNPYPRMNFAVRRHHRTTRIADRDHAAPLIRVKPPPVRCSGTLIPYDWLVVTGSVNIAAEHGQLRGKLNWHRNLGTLFTSVVLSKSVS